MADSAVVITAGTGTNIDTRTESTNGNHRQVMVIGDPSTNTGVAPVDVTSGLKVDLGADNDVTITSGTITAVTSITNALPTGTNAIGTVTTVGAAADSAAVSGNPVRVGGSDGTNTRSFLTDTSGRILIGVGTTGGWSVGNFTTGDSFTALTNTAQVIKGSAGKFGGYYIYNPNTVATYVIVYDVAAASVTVGTTNPKLVFCIPASSGANVEFLAGIPFSTAMSIAAATTGGGNSAPSTALEAMIFYI